MPVWYEQTKHLVEAGDLVVLGIVQEQHADRCRLFAQWKGIDWPILHDPLNLIGIQVVPVVIAIDEHGIVRDTKPSLDTLGPSFVAKKFPAPDNPHRYRIETLPDPRGTRRYAGEARDADHWRAHGDALILAGLPPQIDEAITAYGRALEKDPADAAALFRLGVAHRIRHDRPQRRPDDFQLAADAWRKALRSQPNHYIYRRRIQQYGPRLDKPYPFYDWIATARQEITARGATPVTLACEPTGAEQARPARKFKSDSNKGPRGDPKGKIRRDKKLILVTTAVVRGTDKNNRNVVQVHLTFRPRAENQAHWNNESDPLRLWIKKPKTGRRAKRFLEHPNPDQAVSNEERTLSFEIKLPSKQKGSLTVKAYALYNVCEGKDGKCQFLRQDVKVKIKL